jgi:hypothetical protein
MGRIRPVDRQPLGCVASLGYDLARRLGRIPPLVAQLGMSSARHGTLVIAVAPALSAMRQPAEGTMRERAVQRSYFTAAGGTDLTGSGRR